MSSFPVSGAPAGPAEGRLAAEAPCFGVDCSAPIHHHHNAHARLAAAAAARLGYGFESLDGADCYLFAVSRGARWAALAAGGASPYPLNDARAYSLARDKHFTAQVLARAGVPTIPGRLFFLTALRQASRGPGRELADARALVAAAGPVFVKPNQGARGDFAEIVPDPAAFEAYVARCAGRHEAVLIQPIITGAEHRVLVLHGRALCAYQKTLPSVTADGRRTVAELIAAWAATVDAPGHALSAPTAAGVRPLRTDGGVWRPDDMPNPGEVVRLQGRANRSAGGGAATAPGPAPAWLADVAVRAAGALGLQLAGVDVFDCDPARPGTDAKVIEVNASPGIETLEAHGRTDLIDAIWGAAFAAALA